MENCLFISILLDDLVNYFNDKFSFNFRSQLKALVENRLLELEENVKDRDMNLPDLIYKFDLRLINQVKHKFNN